MIRIGFCPYFQYVTDNALKQIHFAILMIGRVYAKKSASLRFLEIDTLFCF